MLTFLFGSTEFVPTTHQDAEFSSLAPDIIKSNELDEFYLHPTAVKPSCFAGGYIIFDIRTMHRGGCNFSSSNRDVLYLTFAWDWFADAHMFNSKSLVPKEDTLTRRALVEGLTGIIGEEVAWKVEGVGHPHYTSRFEDLLMDVLEENEEKGRANVKACRKFLSTPAFERETYVQGFLRTMKSKEARDEKVKNLR